MWLDILKSRVEASSMGIVADELELSRTTISLVVNGKYPASTDKIATKVIARYSTIACPFLEREITGAECRDFHTREAPTSSPFAMRHWRACQGCSHRRPK
jgi:hypothetical protein